MPAEAIDKLFAGVIMALRTALFKTIHSRERADLSTQLPVEAMRITGEESAAEGIAHARRVYDLIFRHGGDMDGVCSRVKIRPVFAARGVEIIDGPRKLKERHLKMALKQDGRIFRAVAWRAAERHDFLAGHKTALDVAFSLEQNQYNGETYVELTLADLKSPDPQIQRSPDS